MGEWVVTRTHASEVRLLICRLSNPYQNPSSSEPFLFLSETLSIFQNNRVNSLSLLFCHSSSNSVSIPVYFFAYLHSLPIHFLIFLFPVICFELLITRIFFFYFPRRFELSGVICLVPRRLSLDETVRAKEGEKVSVLFQWSLAAHHQSLAITLRKTKCLRRRLSSYDQHQNRKNSGYFFQKEPSGSRLKSFKARNPH